MQDAIIKGNGNSRYLKTVAAALSLYPTYEDFLHALVAGNFPIDLNGINEAGWTQQGTPLNKANLLPDALATSLGLPATATVADALFGAAIYPLPKKIASYETAGSFTWTAPDLANGKAYKIGVLIIGAGGSGGIAAPASGSSARSASGGASGYSLSMSLTVNPNESKALVVGKGGEAVTSTVNGGYGSGKAGGSSSFDGISVNGGEPGSGTVSSTVVGAKGGQGTYGGHDGSYGYEPPVSKDFSDHISCINIFEKKGILGSGGGVHQSGNNGARHPFKGGKNPQTGLGGGDGKSAETATVTAESGTEPGCGGGAAQGKSGGGAVTSGAGADGAVYIYFLGVAD